MLTLSACRRVWAAALPPEDKRDVQKSYYACCWCHHLAMQELLSCKAQKSKVQGTLVRSTRLQHTEVASPPEIEPATSE